MLLTYFTSKATQFILQKVVQNNNRKLTVRVEILYFWVALRGELILSM